MVSLLSIDKHTTVLYYFCNNYRASEVNGLAPILRTFCSQLIQAKADLSSYIFDEYVGKGLHPSVPNLLELLPLLLSCFETVRIIVDGLDEWDPRSKKNLVTDLIPLASSNGAADGMSHKLLFSSRDVPPINRVLSSKSTVSLSEEKSVVDGAIRRFVHASIADMQRRFTDSVEPNVLEEIGKQLVLKSEGTFLP